MPADRRPVRRPWLATCCLVAVTLPLAARSAAPAPAAATAAPARFTLRQVFDLQWAEDPRIAPDGKRVAFVRASFDVMTDAERHAIWVVGSDGRGLRPLSAPDEDATSPRWSPGGDRLAYVVAVPGGRAEIRLRWLDGGDSARLASLEHAPRGLVFSPDGSQLAFATFVPAPPEADIARLPEKPEGADWGPPIRVVDRIVYRRDGRGYLPPGRTHLFVAPAIGGAPRQVTFGDFDDDGAPVWTPDGGALLFSANRRADAELQPVESEIYRVSLADGSVEALTSRVGPDGSPAVSPDGSKIAYVGFDDRHQGYQVSQLYVMDRDGGGPRAITAALDRDVESPAWDGDGRGLVFQYDDRGTTKIAHVTLAGEVTDLAGDVGGLDLGRPYSGGAFSVAPASGVFAFTLTAPDHPADVAVGSRAGAGSRRLTDLDGALFAHEELGRLEEIRFPSSFDGREIQGWVLRPPGFDPATKYPLVLEIHGGPFANYGPRFSAEMQLYAAAGYLVLYVNPRGSTSYGGEFGNLIHHDYPNHDFEDLMSGVDAVVARGEVDPHQLFVTGGSGGGVLSAWIVGHTDRFRAAVVIKPVINWYSWALTADLPGRAVDYWFTGYPWEHQDEYMRRSPIAYAGAVTTPTMVITGESDYRTPSSDAEQLYEALKLRRVPAAMVRIPDASHNIAAKPSNLVAKVAYVLGWFDRYRETER